MIPIIVISIFFLNNSKVIETRSIFLCESYLGDVNVQIPSNPMDSVKLPSPRATPVIPIRKKDKVVVPSEMVTAIFERFPKGHSCFIPLTLYIDVDADLVKLLSFLWDDVDFEHKILDINKQIQK